ncbi:hypothetical protein [Dyadobacter sp.]|uniref:hypothetical protein n=1 Tax=Dyadobacter sp. TaxID=1914288 RepID=UPI0032658B99
MAAFIGTMVFLLNGKKRGRNAIIAAVLTNYLVAVYVTALVAEMASLKSLESLAFAIGFGGFNFVERLIDKIFDKITNNLNNGTTDNSAS